MKISDVDKNFVPDGIPADWDYELHSLSEPAFEIFGVTHTPDGFVRLPSELAERVNDGVAILYRNTAGGRVRFYTDSPYILVFATARSVTDMVHMTRVGSAGFDVYSDGAYACSLTAEWKRDGDIYCYCAARALSASGEITVNMPLYNDVAEMFIGVARGSTLLPSRRKYAHTHPVVYYGSSITQGGCASRPGMSYQAILSRRLNIDHINLGFSGSARGEGVMAEHIASLGMSAFVMDYDYNAPTVEHLRATHKPFFDVIRAAHPTLPIIMMSRPNYNLSEDDERCAVIRDTYNSAILSGDRNVYYISGRELMADARDEGTVDGCHPTDLGFWSMANALEPVLAKALGLDGSNR